MKKKYIDFNIRIYLKEHDYPISVFFVWLKNAMRFHRLERRIVVKRVKKQT